MKKWEVYVEMEVEEIHGEMAMTNGEWVMQKRYAVILTVMINGMGKGVSEVDLEAV